MREFSEQDKQRISKQFCSFCCSVLKNEANNIRAEYKHYADLEMDFSFLSDKEQAELYTFDCYFVTDNVFNVCDIRIIVSNNMLAEAINKLAKQQFLFVRVRIVCTKCFCCHINQPQ